MAVAAAAQDLLTGPPRGTDAGMSRRELFVELLCAAGFLAVATGLVLAQPPHSVPVLSLVVAIAVLALASQARFETPLGFTLATQLAFVPLLFVVPMSLVPFVVLAALVLGVVPEIGAGKLGPNRVVLRISNAWFAVGPAVVFLVAGRSPASASAGLLVLALLSQFALDFAVSAFRLRAGLGVGLRDQLGESAWIYAIDAALSPMALAAGMGLRPGVLAMLAPVPLVGLLAVFGQERRQRLESLLELNNAYRGTALLLGEVVEADDGYTSAHSRGVVGLAVAVGEELGLDRRRRRNLEFAALLHDVGKIAIPKHIINKPGSLDADEWELIRTHTLEGQRMLNRVGGSMRSVGAIVRSHHERWDGGGYPDALAGEAIPLEARIITCCDSWNAMRTDRPYRAALSVAVAVAEIQNNVGRQFDPRVAAALLRVLEPELAAARSQAADAADAADVRSKSASTPAATRSPEPSEAPVVSVLAG